MRRMKLAAYDRRVAWRELLIFLQKQLQRLHRTVGIIHYARTFTSRGQNVTYALIRSLVVDFAVGAVSRVVGEQKRNRGQLATANGIVVIAAACDRQKRNRWIVAHI